MSTKKPKIEHAFGPVLFQSVGDHHNGDEIHYTYDTAEEAIERAHKEAQNEGGAVLVTEYKLARVRWLKLKKTTEVVED